MRVLFSALLALALPVTAAAAPRLLKDLNPGPQPDGGAYLGFLEPVVRDGVLYFGASDPAHGFELWRTDGTPAGTYRLADICPGACGSAPSGFAFSRGQIFFVADDGSSGRELWRSDGTPGSERRVRDLCPGPCDTRLGYQNALAPAGNVLYFQVEDSRGATLWRTTGSRRSTVQIATLCTTAAGRCSAFGLTTIGDHLLVQVTEPSGQNAFLWSSDGTAAGTGPLTGPDGAPIRIERLIVDGDFAFLHTPDGLWRTDGTAAGTFRLFAWSALPQPPSELPGEWSVLWRGSYYAAFAGGTLLVSDGTIAGTRLVSGFPDFAYVSSVAATEDRILLLSGDGTLWRTTGDPATTERFFVPEGSPSDVVQSLVPLGNRAIFNLYRSETEKSELWVTDGTAAGTRRFLGLESGYASVVAVGDLAFFTNGDSSTGSYDELWRTDGTEAGTRRVRDFGDLPASSGPLDQAALGGAVIFSAQVSEHEVPLFRTDGTRAGTRLLSAEATRARRFTPAGGRLFFATADDDVYPGTSTWYVRPSGVWSTNGTAAGTVPASRQVVSFEPVGALGGAILFGGADRLQQPFGGPEIEPWRATVDSAARIKDVNRFLFDTGHHHVCAYDGSKPGPGIAVGGRVIFAADDGRFGRELWTSDGTAAGTRLLADINPRRAANPPEPDCDNRRDTGLPSNPEELVPLRQGALFTADDGLHGRELWWTDGTQAGTRRVIDLLPGAASPAPHGLTPLRNLVYFFAAIPGGGEGLWRTDGTARGTVLVRGLALAGLPSWGNHLTAAGDRLFFTVYNESTGTELWTSRGDAASTRLVADLRPGAPGSFPQALTAVGSGRILFAADDGETGLEPWVSDGTVAGTARLGDVNPGRDASSPGPFTLGAGFALTGAWEPAHGREPWVIPLP